MSNFKFLFTFTLCVNVHLIQSAKILTVLPIPYNEHELVYRPLLESLHSSGHQLTVLTTNPYFSNGDQVYENVTEIDLSFVYHLDVLNELTNIDAEGPDMLKTVFRIMRNLFEAELKSPKVKQLLNDKNEYFDLVIVDWSGSSSIMNIFAHHFNAPLVAITNGEAFPNAHEAFGNPNHPVSYPSVFLPFNENLSLIQRIFSTFSAISYRFYYYTEEIPLQNEIIKNVMQYKHNEVDMWKIESNADLLLVNSYEVLNNIRPSVPTTIYLGGLHKNRNTDLSIGFGIDKFLENSSGAVYVNLNTGLLRHNSMRLQKLLHAFENLNIDIIWNANDELINTTQKVYQGFDLDQESILAHSKVVLHISDGGQRNIEDTIHHAVPVFGISYSTSPEHYLYQIEKFDCGIITLIDFDNQQEVEDKLREALNSKKFKKNIKKLRSITQDQPISDSVDRAVWWIEYVIRHGGTKHMRNEHKTLSWFKFLMLDVALTVAFGFMSVLFAFVYIVKRIRRYSQSLPFERVTRGSKKAKIQ